MSNPLSAKYLRKVELHLLNGYPIGRCNMTADGKLRVKICKQVYQLSVDNPMIDYRTTIKNIALQYGVTRTSDEIRNDLQLINHITSFMEQGCRAIEKRKVEHASDWMMRYGMTTGTWQSVDRGIQRKMELNGGFKEEGADMNDFDKVLPTVITNDISVLKPGLKNYTDEEKARIARKVGLPVKEVETMLENQDGVFETAPVEEEPDFDIYDENKYNDK